MTARGWLDQPPRPKGLPMACWALPWQLAALLGLACTGFPCSALQFAQVRGQLRKGE